MRSKLLLLLAVILTAACAQPPRDSNVKITIAFVTEMARQAMDETTVTPLPPEPIQITETIPPPDNAAEAAVVTVQVNAANIRSGPGMNFEPFSSASLGQVFPVIGLSDDGHWYMIRLVDGQLGWIGATVVSLQTDNRFQAIPSEENIQPQVTDTPQPPLPSAPTPSQGGCCMYCRKGKPCGDACISRSKNCNVGPGCACSASIENSQSILYVDSGIPYIILVEAITQNYPN